MSDTPEYRPKPWSECKFLSPRRPPPMTPNEYAARGIGSGLPPSTPGPVPVRGCNTEDLRRVNRIYLRGSLPWNYCPVCGYELAAKGAKHAASCAGEGLE